jgi:transcriptional regulator GlxA family with amidase domain
MWSQEHERRAAEMRQRNDRERLAARLGHGHLRIAEIVGTSGALERHYSVQEIAELWQLSRTTVARIFRDEPGVLKIGRERPRRGSRAYMTLRIPESVVAIGG